MRDWLGSSLRIDRKGEYLLGEARGLGDLPSGSIVLFHFKGKIVGEAVVAQPPKEIDHEKRNRDDVSDELKHYVVFVPESIRAYPEKLFISDDEFKEITGKSLRHHFDISPEQYLLLIRKLAEKSATS